MSYLFFRIFVSTYVLLAKGFLLAPRHKTLLIKLLNKDIMLKYIPVPAMVIDADTAIIKDANSLAQDLLVRDESTLVGKTITQLLPELTSPIEHAKAQGLFEQTQMSSNRNGLTYVYDLKIQALENAPKELILTLVLQKDDYTFRLINATPDIICFKDGKGRWLLANDADLKLFCLQDVNYYGKTDKELAKYTHPVFVEAFHACGESDEQAWLSGKTEHYEELIPDPKGDIHVYDVIKTPIFHPNGERQGLFVLGRDISARHKAQKELELSHETYLGILNSISEAIYIMSEDSVFIEVNKGAEIMYGMSREELIGLSPADVGAKGMNDLQAIAEKSAQAFLTGKVYRFEFWAVRKNGEVFPKEVILNKGRFFGKGVLIATARDITYKKQSDEALELSRKHFETIFEHSPIPLWEEDFTDIYNYLQTKKKEGVKDFKAFFNQYPEEIYKCVSLIKILNLNKAALELHDASSKEELLLNFHKTFTDKSLDPLIEELAIIAEGGKELFVEGEVLTLKGELRYIRLKMIILDSNENKHIAIISTTDITENKKAEIELLQAKERAEESDRLKSAFLANMSHEIRTPMNGILGFASLLKEPQIDVQDKGRYIEIIERSGERMLNIINDLVDISKIEAGQMEILIEDSNVNDHIEYLYNFFKPEAKQKGLGFSSFTDLTYENAYILTDREKLYAILTNLLKNAIKYTHKGQISFGYIKKDNFLEFTVEDSGIGIGAQDQKSIFDRFVQADSRLNSAYEGAGLGLAITRAYVEMLGGEIWVVSERQIGSCFHFTIPYKESVKPRGKNTRSLSKEFDALPSLSLMIVDDDPTASLLLEEIFKKNSRKIIKTDRGSEAIELSKKHPDLDLILLDIKMPGIDGLKAVKEIRKFNSDVLIIAQTANALSGDRMKAINSGCNDYLSKPLNKNDLYQIIEKYFYRQE